MTGYCYGVNETDFEELVVARSRQVPVLLDIGADWCSPCLVLGPMLEKLAKEYSGKFVLAKVDADENMRIAGRHKVRGFPTVIAYSRGQETARFHSAQPVHFLRSFIDKLIEHHTATSPEGAQQVDDRFRKEGAISIPAHPACRTCPPDVL